MDPTVTDPLKARELLIHCVSASQKFSHRDMSKRELVSKLKKLYSFSADKAFRQHLIELEGHMNDLLKKERRILTSSKRARETRQGIQERINTLEEKLNRYIKQRSMHEVQLKELESTVNARMKRRQAVQELKSQIRALEDLYEEVVQERYQYEPSKLRGIEKRLETLKAQLQKEGGK